MTQVSILFVHSGSAPIPECMIQSIAIASKAATKSKILILTNEVHIKGLAESLVKIINIGSNNPIVIAIEGLKKTEHALNFEANPKNNRVHLNGFWYETSNRFILIASLMRALNIENCLHLENDNVLFFEPMELIEKFRKHARFSIPFDRTRAIPGIVWFKDCEIAEDLAISICNNPGRPDFDVIREFCDSRPNDTKPLPTMSPSYANSKGLNIENYCAGYEEFGGVFDASALGQYAYSDA